MVSSLIDIIKESRTGNNPKVTLGSEISVFGYFDTQMLYETVFNFMSLFLTSSKRKRKRLDHLSD